MIRHKLVSKKDGVFSVVLLLFLLTTLPVAAEKQPVIKRNKPLNQIRPVAAVNSQNGSVFPVGKYAVILKQFLINKDQFYDGNDEVDFSRPDKGKKPSEKSLYRTELILRTGIVKNFDTRIIIPYLDKKLQRKSSNADFTNDINGIGDVMLLNRYQIMSQQTGPVNTMIGLGVKIPTGSTDKTEDNGKLLPPFLQTGSGSWDPIIEFGIHKISGSHWFSSFFAYRMSTEGKWGEKDFKHPDIFKYNFAYSYALSSLFDAGFEFNGIVLGKSETNESKDKNSGGHTVFLSPEIHYKFAKNMHLGLCIPIAIYQDLNGQQPGEDFRIVAKFAMVH